MSHFSLVTSPITLIPSPGPGNGCLNIKSSSIPNSKPIFLTSSLNNSLKGSTIWNSISSGIPPTLWWDFIVAASPCPLSTTSGYIVPWTKKSIFPSLFDSSSNTLMNSSPIIFLLASGSVTPFNLPKNLSSQLTLIKFISNLSLNILSTSLPSFFLSKPWSTNTQVKLSPIALWTSTAATDESTPPLKAQSTFLSPIISFNSFILSAINESVVQSPLTPQTLYKKFLSTLSPSWQCSTSGWNCTPYNFFSVFSIAATGQSLVCAIDLNPSGSLSIKSVWLIHTIFVDIPSNIADSLYVISVFPYSFSAFVPFLTLPPNIWDITCIP